MHVCEGLSCFLIDLAHVCQEPLSGHGVQGCIRGEVASWASKYYGCHLFISAQNYRYGMAFPAMMDLGL